jgi:hypothetical protein
MIVAGLQAAIGGPDTVLGVDDASTNVGSEFRFYGAWYAAAGVLLLRATGRLDQATFEIRLVAAAFFVAAFGRFLSIVRDGGPHTLYIALMIVEFVIALVLVPWHAAVTRREQVNS